MTKIPRINAPDLSDDESVAEEGSSFDEQFEQTHFAQGDNYTNTKSTY